MAERGSGRAVVAAIGVAAGAGAAQLGVAYGLGIVNWLPSADEVADSARTASLAWAVWIAATSTLVGAVGADRLTRRSPDGSAPDAQPPATGTGALRRTAIAVSAAVGALVTVVLVAVPAWTAGVTPSAVPGYAGAGVAIGLVMAFWVLASRAAAHNVVGTISWLWLLGVVAVVDDIVSGRDPVEAQLGFWYLAFDGAGAWLRDHRYLGGAVLSLAVAGLVGVVAARASAKRPEARVGTALSGAAGPVVVAAAYLVAAPRLAEFEVEQFSAHLTVAYAVIAGLAGSGLVAALAQRAESRARLASAAPPDGDSGTAPDGDAGTPKGDAGTPKADVEPQPTPPSGKSGNGKTEKTSKSSKAPAGEPAEAAQESDPADPAEGAPERKPRRPARRKAQRAPESESTPA